MEPWGSTLEVTGGAGVGGAVGGEAMGRGVLWTAGDIVVMVSGL